MGKSLDRDRLIDDIKILFQETYGSIDEMTIEGLLALRKWWLIVGTIILEDIEGQDREGTLRDMYAVARLADEMRQRQGQDR